MLLTKLSGRLSAPSASLYTVFFGGISIIRLLSYRHKALRYLLGRGILQIVASAMPERTYWNKHTICADPICALERVEGAEPSSTAWKAVIIAVIRYPHFVVLFCFLHIYYSKNFTENQIFTMEGSGRIELPRVGPQPTGLPLA